MPRDSSRPADHLSQGRIERERQWGGQAVISRFKNYGRWLRRASNVDWLRHAVSVPVVPAGLPVTIAIARHAGRSEPFGRNHTAVGGHSGQGVLVRLGRPVFGRPRRFRVFSPSKAVW